MAGYGLVVSGLVAGAVACQASVFKFRASASALRIVNDDENKLPSLQKDGPKEAQRRKFTVQSAPEYDGLHYYETFIWCPDSR